MLITIVDVVGCENPRCTQFAKPVDIPRNMRTYYCQTCGCVSRVRAVDARIAASPEQYKEFLLRAIAERAAAAENDCSVGNQQD